MINISINEGNVQTKISGSGVVILAEMVTSVGALYDNLKELCEKPVADFYAFLAKDLLEKRVKGIDVESEPLEAAEKPKSEQHSEEKCEPGETDDLSAAKCKFGAAMDAITALEKLKTLIDKSKKEEV